MTGSYDRRTAVGVWAEWPVGFKWANEGMVRLLGFLIEGAAAHGGVTFRIVVPAHIAPEAVADLRTLRAVEGVDYIVHAPTGSDGMAAEMEGDQLFRSLAAFANRSVPVDGWLVLFPHFSFSRLLKGPKATVFPDAIPRIFPHFSEEAWGALGSHAELSRKVAAVLRNADRVVTFSHHVANNQAKLLYGVPAERLRVSPHALPDLHGVLDFVPAGAPTPASKRLAATLLREHSALSGWRYLADFPFEEVEYLAVSTQDRSSKNVSIVARALDLVLREHRKNLKVITTAPFHFGADWTTLLGLVEKRQLQRDFLSMPNLPRMVHAAFYHCAALTVHSSFFEGGRAPFPLSEALSVGTPCLFADGPHTRELLEEAPALRAFMFDAHDADGLASLIGRSLDERDALLDTQQPIVAGLLAQRSWADVAWEYASAATAGRADGNG